MSNNRPTGSPHVRSLGAYSQSEAVTEEGQVPDRFGQYQPAFGVEGPDGLLEHKRHVLADRMDRLQRMHKARVAAAPLYAASTVRDQNFHAAKAQASDADVMAQRAIRMLRNREANATYDAAAAETALNRAILRAEALIRHPAGT